MAKAFFAVEDFDLQIGIAQVAVQILQKALVRLLAPGGEGVVGVSLVPTLGVEVGRAVGTVSVHHGVPCFLNYRRG